VIPPMVVRMSTPAFISSICVSLSSAPCTGFWLTSQLKKTRMTVDGIAAFLAEKKRYSLFKAHLTQ
jgi:hypothetical protein